MSYFIQDNLRKGR